LLKCLSLVAISFFLLNQEGHFPIKFMFWLFIRANCCKAFYGRNFWKLAREKRSSLLGIYLNNSRKKSYNNGPCRWFSSRWKAFSPSALPCGHGSSSPWPSSPSWFSSSTLATAYCFLLETQLLHLIYKWLETQTDQPALNMVLSAPIPPAFPLSLPSYTSQNFGPSCFNRFQILLSPIFNCIA